MFDRFEAFKQAIADKSISVETLAVMIDFHYSVGNFTDAQKSDLMGMLYPSE